MLVMEHGPRPKRILYVLFVYIGVLFGNECKKDVEKLKIANVYTEN